MKMSKKWITILCACLMTFSLAAGIVNVNVSANLAKAEQISAEEQAKNEAFIKNVKSYTTYSADALDTLLKPIWNTDEVFDETATVVGETGSTQLLYTPVKGSVVIRDYHIQRYYVEDVDFEIDYETGKLTRKANGELPYFAMDEYISPTVIGAYTIGYDPESESRKLDEDLLGSGFKYIRHYGGNYLPRHFSVSYRVNTSADDEKKTPDENAAARWAANYKDTAVTDITSAYSPVSKASTYAKFLNQLESTNQATIMFYGDSIMFGCNATGYEPGGGLYNPYTPRWSEMFTAWLEREYCADITYLNGAVGGWTTTDGWNYWGEIHSTSEMGQRGQIPQEYADDADLLVLGFGMNDATSNNVGKESYSMSATNEQGELAYKANLRKMIDSYIKERGDKGGSILLMSHMMPNTQSTWYTEASSLHQQIEGWLDDLVDEYSSNEKLAIAVAPISSVFKTMEEKGKFTRNFLSNNINHPTDFGVRVYAQTVLQTITGYANFSQKVGDAEISGDIIMGEGASVRLNTIAVENGMSHSFMAGIRYRAYISESFFDGEGGKLVRDPNDMESIKMEDRYKAGMWMIPKSILSATKLPFDQNLDYKLQMARYGSYDPSRALVYDVPAEIWDDRDDDKQMHGYVRFNAAMLQLPEAQFGTDLVARAYIYDTQTKTYYVSRGMQTRNIAQVASMALMEEQNFTPSQKKLLEWFIAGGVSSSGAGLPDKFIYNGVEKFVAYPNTTYKCSNCQNEWTTTELIDAKYCPNSSCLHTVFANANRVNWCAHERCNKIIPDNEYRANDNRHYIAGEHSYVAQTKYRHDVCGKMYSVGELIAGKYCPTCSKVATEIIPDTSNPDTVIDTVLPLTVGDTFKLNATSTGIMPKIMVNKDNTWFLFSEVYGDYFTYNAKTGTVTVIKAPNDSVLSIPVAVTLQSKDSLNEKGIDNSEKILTQEWTIDLFNASFNTHRNAYRFAQILVQYIDNNTITLDLPAFDYPSSDLDKYVELEYSCAGANITIDTNNGKLILTPTAGVFAVGTYTLNVSAVANNPVRNVLKTKQIKITVEETNVYDHMILDSQTDQFSDQLAEYGSEYLTYDASEQAYHFASTESKSVSLIDGNRFTEKCEKGEWKYEYFLMDIKFSYENGKVVGENCVYDNALAFLMFDGTTLYFSNDSTQEQLHIYKADDPSARKLHYSEIAPGCWYTIAIPMTEYGSIPTSEGFTLFQSGVAGKKGSATDIYFGNLRWGDYVGNKLNDEALKLETTVAGTGGNTIVQWMADYDGGAWKYTTPNPQGVCITVNKDGVREYTNNQYGVHLKDIGMDAYNELAPQYSYMAIDMLFSNTATAAPLIVFSNGGDPVGFGGYKGIASANNKAESQEFLVEAKRSGYVHRLYRVNDLNNPIGSAELGIWQTVILKNPKPISNYLFGILSYTETNIPANTEVYFRNIRFLNELEENMTATPSVNDFVMDNQTVISNMHVTGNTRQEEGAGKNPLVPSPLNDPDASFVDNPTITPADMWFETAGSWKTHTSPESITSSMSVDAHDNTVTQFKFTNWGYTYSDKIKFDKPMLLEQVESISFRIYAVLSPYSVYNVNFTSSSNPYRYQSVYCLSCEKHFVNSTSTSTPCDACGGALTKSYKDKRGNFFVAPANRDANYIYAHNTQVDQAWIDAYEAGWVSGVLKADGSLNTDWGKKTYNNYDVSRGGIRFYPFGSSNAGTETNKPSESKGLMLPTDIKQGEWTTVTFTDPAQIKRLDDGTGYFSGFWVGQSADSRDLDGAEGSGRVHTFIDAGVATPGCAYMNVDTISATFKDTRDGITIDMSEKDTSIGGSTGTAGMVGSATPFYHTPNDKRNVLVFNYPLGGHWIGYNQIKFNTLSKGLGEDGVLASDIDSITMRFYLSQKIARNGEVLKADGKGGIFLHSYNPSYLHERDATKGYPAVLTDGYGYRLMNTAIGFQTITITGEDIKKFADSDGYVRGFILTMDKWALTSLDDINVADPNDNRYAASIQILIDYMDIQMKDTQPAYSAENGYKFITQKGWTSDKSIVNQQDTVRYVFKGTMMANMRTYLSSHKYISLDVMFEEKNNLIFAQGVAGAGETYYALKGGFTMGRTPVKPVMVFLKGQANTIEKRELSYEELVEDTWYTVLIPIDKPASVTSADYNFGVMTYADGVSLERCTAWLNNVHLTSQGDLKLIGDDGTDFDMITRFVSGNESVVDYKDYGGEIGKAYKLNKDGFMGFSDDAKVRIGKTSAYSRMTMEFRLEDFANGVNVAGSALYNALFFNGGEVAIGIREMINNGDLIANDVARVYDAEGNEVALSEITADVWYTVEILNPVIDWAFLGSTGTDIYFRNMIWYVGESDVVVGEVTDKAEEDYKEIHKDDKDVIGGDLEDWS